MSSSSTGPRCFSSSARICGQRLPQLPLFAIGLTMILVFTAISACEDDRASLTSAEAGSNRKANCSQMQQNAAGASWKPGSFERTQSFYEKNAIFSAWLMRRIGASGSLAAVIGFRSMPLAMRVEPSDTSIAGTGTGAGGTGAGGGGG